VLSLMYRKTCKLLLGANTRDTETGCKFFRRETASDVVLGSECDGWFWDTEVMTRAELNGLRLIEMPVLFLRRWDKASTVRVLPDSLRYLVELSKFRPKVGLSLMQRSPVYWTCVGYDMTMKALYGAHYHETYAEVARRIPADASVVDVCCGTGRLWQDHLRAQGNEYLGLDFNGHFVMGLRKRGGHARLFDLRTEDVPSADYVVMCSSFYHSLGTEDAMFSKLMAAARKAVIISEPVRNVSSSSIPLVGAVSERLTNAGDGERHERFDLDRFRRFAEDHGASEFAYERGQRNAVAVFPKH
jgi:SAM-dependent methyltransferase